MPSRKKAPKGKKKASKRKGSRKAWPPVMDSIPPVFEPGEECQPGPHEETLYPD